MNAILCMQKPYGRIKDLPDLMQGIKTAYGTFLEQKKEEVYGIITLCMGDVHTLAGVGSKASDEDGKRMNVSTSISKKSLRQQA